MNVREWALPVYTILMQMAVGSLFALWVLRSFAFARFKPGVIDRFIRNPILVIIFTAVVAMVAAHFHLSKPFLSYRAVLNFKSSWLSREIVFTTIFFWSLAGLLYLTFYKAERRRLISVTGWLAILMGAILVYCMASIYLLPAQVAWNSNWVILSFFVTALMLGVVALACLMLLDLKFSEIQKAADIKLRVQWIKYSMGSLTTLVVILVFASIAITLIQMKLLSIGGLIAQTSLELLLDLYFPLLVMRLVLLISALILQGVAVYRMYRFKLIPQKIFLRVYLACLLILIGEIIGRFLFYATHIRVGL
jgi:anaerobic dimethyl sulfoxide reductase subunit C (anchor subunit)